MKKINLVFLSFMCSVIIFCNCTIIAFASTLTSQVSTINTQAVTLYFPNLYDIDVEEKNFKWNNSVEATYLQFTWLIINAYSATTPPSYDNLAAGTAYWTSAISAIRASYCLPSEQPATNYIIHSVPTTSWWVAQDEALATNPIAFTRPVNTTGETLLVGATYTSPLIASASIFYSPSINFSTRAQSLVRNTIAHEIGHCLGFGHIPDTQPAAGSNSVMYYANQALVGLGTNDLTYFNRKYSFVS